MKDNENANSGWGQKAKEPFLFIGRVIRGEVRAKVKAEAQAKFEAKRAEVNSNDTKGRLAAAEAAEAAKQVPEFGSGLGALSGLGQFKLPYRLPNLGQGRATAQGHDSAWTQPFGQGLATEEADVTEQALLSAIEQARESEEEEATDQEMIPEYSGTTDQALASEQVQATGHVQAKDHAMIPDYVRATDQILGLEQVETAGPVQITAPVQTTGPAQAMGPMQTTGQEQAMGQEPGPHFLEFANRFFGQEQVQTAGPVHSTGQEQASGQEPGPHFLEFAKHFFGQEQVQEAGPAQARPLSPEDKLGYLEDILDYKFQSPALGLEALQGFTSEGLAVPYHDTVFQVPKNNRLAIFGDAILDAMVSEEWYEGDGTGRDWTRKHDDLLSNAALGEAGMQLGIDQCLLIASQAPSPYTIATGVEAVIGAVMREAGWDRTKQLLRRLVLLRPPVLVPRASTPCARYDV
jgi:hypothetical protein